MSKTLYISVKHEKPPGEQTADASWVRADVVLNGVSVAHAFAPNFGIYKQDRVAAKSAVALAQFQFSKLLASDIRLTDEVRKENELSDNSELVVSILKELGIKQKIKSIVTKGR